MNNILNSLDFPTAFEQLTPKLLEGFQVAILATICGFLLALILGTLIALGRLSKFKILRGFLIVFIEIIRGTPLLVQLVYMYYVVPLLVMLIIQMWDPNYKFVITPFVAGTIGLGINYGSYLSEVIRSSIVSIDKGQKEAALALGYTEKRALWEIVMPQAAKNSIPVFGNYLVMMIKDTSLLAFITVSELLLISQTYASSTFLTIESYTILALAYLLISVPLSQLMNLVDRRLQRNG